MVKALIAKALIRYAEEKVKEEERVSNAAPGASSPSSTFPTEVIGDIFKALLQGSRPHTLPNAVQEQVKTLFKEARQVCLLAHTLCSAVCFGCSFPPLFNAPSSQVCPKLQPIQTEADVFSVNIEEEANNYFGKIYSNQISVQQLIEMLDKFKNSSEQREVVIQPSSACSSVRLFVCCSEAEWIAPFVFCSRILLFRCFLWT